MWTTIFRSAQARFALLSAICVALTSSVRLLEAESDREALTLITNVHVFDGLNEERNENAQVLV